MTGEILHDSSDLHFPNIQEIFTTLNIVILQNFCNSEKCLEIQEALAEYQGQAASNSSEKKESKKSKIPKFNKKKKEKKSKIPKFKKSE